MARLIPGFLDEHAPPGERQLFSMLAAGPDDWTAFHSLDLTPWNRGLRTEIDFVVVVPDTGIACVEVKSQERISFDGDRWSPPTIRRSPFKQATDGRYTFQRRLAEIAPHLRYIPVVHCCVFPNAAFEVRGNLSVQAWELIDRRTFEAAKTGRGFCDALVSRMRRAIAADQRLHALPRPLTRADVAEIVSLCLPIQPRGLEDRDDIERRAAAAEAALLEQQRPVLRLAGTNARLLVAGAAGTGKTQIALELARRHAEAGRRVALLCFNEMIGTFMRDRVSVGRPLPNLLAGRAISVLAQLADVPIPASASQTFWDSELPAALEERFTDPDLGAAARFDCLILDEAQDVLGRRWLMECLALLLDGGFENGHWVFFGDFSHQVLGSRAEVERGVGYLVERCRPAQWTLFDNCRNYQMVAESAVSLAGFAASPYERYLRQGGGRDAFDIHFYADQGEQVSLLDRSLREALARGFLPSEIVILSFRAEHCAAAILRSRGGRVRPAWQQGPGSPFATIHAFKGMESKVVILTDVYLTGEDWQRDLLYTGLTRATEVVRVLCDQRSKPILADWIRKEQP